MSSPRGADDLELEGKVLSADASGLVILVKNKPIIVEARDILDIHRSSLPSKIVRRKMRYIPPWQARQHLLDRHGLQWDLIKMLAVKSAGALHDKIDHTNLGHQHRESEEDE